MSLFCGPSVPEGLHVSAPFRSTGRTCEKKQPVNNKSICANTLDECLHPHKLASLSPYRRQRIRESSAPYWQCPSSK